MNFVRFNFFSDSFEIHPWASLEFIPRRTEISSVQQDSRIARPIISTRGEVNTPSLVKSSHNDDEVGFLDAPIDLVITSIRCSLEVMIMYS
jgi:hypothetical protein